MAVVFGVKEITEMIKMFDMKKLLLFLKKIFFKVGSCFYVGATDVLPEPLSKEDEEYYVKLKEEGDTLAKEKLIEHNLRLVVFLAKKYENTGQLIPQELKSNLFSYS